MRHQQTQSLPDEARWRLRGLGLSPRKALGQHFLVSAQVLESILEAAELGPQDVVVEVGPGLGMVTRELAHRVARVVAVELDGELAAALAQDLRSASNVQVLHADARKVEPRKLLGGDIPYKVVANLPYYAANPILRRFLEAPWKPSLLVVMVQREVAQSMAASPGRMSLLAVSVQFYGRPRIVAY
ncbi:MAG: ribosomal RNA small subunit methyltransferase A, partial [Dehalococcoidia bacterium]